MGFLSLLLTLSVTLMMFESVKGQSLRSTADIKCLPMMPKKWIHIADCHNALLTFDFDRWGALKNPKPYETKKTCGSCKLHVRITSDSVVVPQGTVYKADFTYALTTMINTCPVMPLDGEIKDIQPAHFWTIVKSGWRLTIDAEYGDLKGATECSAPMKAPSTTLLRKHLELPNSAL